MPRLHQLRGYVVLDRSGMEVRPDRFESHVSLNDYFLGGDR
jgi:hypothetical protein